MEKLDYQDDVIRQRSATRLGGVRVLSRDSDASHVIV